MKAKKAIRVALVVTLVASSAYWLGYQHGRSSSRVTLNTPSKPKQVGLAFREGRNDVSRFRATGDVTATNTQTR